MYIFVAVHCFINLSKRKVWLVLVDVLWKRECKLCKTYCFNPYLILILDIKKIVSQIWAVYRSKYKSPRYVLTFSTCKARSDTKIKYSFHTIRWHDKCVNTETTVRYDYIWIGARSEWASKTLESEPYVRNSKISIPYLLDSSKISSSLRHQN